MHNPSRPPSRESRHVLALLVLAASATPSLFAVDKQWTSAASANFDSASWSPAGTPTSADTIITPSAFGGVNLNGNYTVGAFNLGNLSSSWTLRGSGNANRLFDVTGGITYTGGANNSALTFVPQNDTYTLTMTVGGAVSLSTMGQIGFGNSGTNNRMESLTVTGLTTVTNTNTNTPVVRVNAKTANFNGGVRLEVSSTGNAIFAMGQHETLVADTFNVAFIETGAVTAATRAQVVANTLANTATTSGTHTLTINGNSGGTFTFAGQIKDTQNGGTNNLARLAIAKSGNNTQIFSTANLYTGGTTISGGILRASNTTALGTGAVSVAGGTLDSTVANVSVGGLSIASGKISAGGDAGVGSFTLASGQNFSATGGTVFFNLGTAFDQIISAGGSAAFSIASTTLQLDVTGAGFSYTSTYSLLSGFTGTNSISGLSITGYDSGAYTATLGTNGVLSFTAVPEPSAWAAFAGLGALGVAASRRRRRD